MFSRRSSFSVVLAVEQLDGEGWLVLVVVLGNARIPYHSFLLGRNSGRRNGVSRLH